MDWLVFREPFSAWTHGVWLLLALPGTWLLWRGGRGDWFKQLSLLIFGLSLICCFAGSTLFHAVRLPSQELAPFARLDYIGIFLLIAGSYTPAAFTLLRGWWKWGTLTVVWLLAALGIALRVQTAWIPPVLSTSLYLAMGWAAVLCYDNFARVLSHRAMVPVLLGGLFYSIGAVINEAHWPVLWPGIFSAHELMHLFVMAGSLAHFWFMLKCVVPFERRAAEGAPWEDEPDEDVFAGTEAVEASS
jgi:hemolysin III